MAEQFAALNVDMSTVPQHLLNDEEPGGDEYELWEEHEDVTHLFLRVCRQWRVAGESILGLDIGSFWPWLPKLMNIKPTLELFDDLQIMESRAVEILNETKERKQKGGKR